MMFQTRCAGCDAPGVAVCTTCRFALRRALDHELRRHGVHAAVPFTGRARDVVLGLKYRNRRQVARHLAGLVVNTIVVERRPPRPRRGHLGADELDAPTGAGFRPG